MQPPPALTVASAEPTETAAPTPAPMELKTVAEVYPGLTSGALTYAKIAPDLTNGVLAAGELLVTEADLAAAIQKAPAEQQAKLVKAKLLVLENVATEKLLLREARKTAAADATDRAAIQAYMEKAIGTIEVTDAEVKDFYEKNKDSCGGASLDEMKDQLADYVESQKEQTAVEGSIRTLGQRLPIQVAEAWLTKEAAVAMDNPVDKARKSGRPSLVDFGSTGCRPCDMMAPILKDLEKKYEGKANVVFVHVGEEQMLAARYGIQSIPVQVFFDATGKEVSRHTGFYPQAEVEKQMQAMGVK